MFFLGINYVVVVIAALVGMVIGYVWYSPWAFGKLWLKSKGWSDETLRAKKEGKSMAPVFALMTLGTAFTAFVIAVLFNSLILVGFSGIIKAALVLWIGFAVPVKLADYLFGGDTFTFFLISIGHELVVIFVMSFFIGIFG